MIKNFFHPVTALLATLFAVHQVQADDGGFALGAHVGTAGIGLTASYPLTARWNVRGIYSAYDYSQNNEELDDLSYDIELDLETYGVLFDWHPFKSSFRATLGLVNNQNKITGDARPVAGTTVEIGDVLFNASELGTLSTDVSYDDIVPYIGIGWGNATRAKNLSLSFDIGLLYQGDGDVELTNSGADAAIQDLLNVQLAIEERNIEDDLSDYEWYPWLQLGLTYRF